jgi:hypothetical protein
MAKYLISALGRMRTHGVGPLETTAGRQLCSTTGYRFRTILNSRLTDDRAFYLCAP